MSRNRKIFKRKQVRCSKSKDGYFNFEEDIITCYDNLGPICEILKKSNISYDI